MSADNSVNQVRRSVATDSHGATSESLDSRARLIDATLKLILDEGIDAVRIDTVAAAVGVTKGSIYWHFEDRASLIKAALAEQIRRFSAESVSAVSDAIGNAGTKEDYIARIMPFLTNPFDQDQVRARWARLAVLVETHNDPELRAMMRDVQARHLAVVTELMIDAQDKGFLRSDLDPTAVAVALNVVNLGSTIIDVLGEDGPDATAWWRLIGFFIEMLFPPQH